METDAVVGCLVLACALVGITYLVLWSRRTINWIAEKGERSSREIMKELDGDA